MKTPVICFLSIIPAKAQTANALFYKLRIYHCFAGRLPALKQRFRNHARTIFKKHGIINVGYWEPVENTGNDLNYRLAYPSLLYQARLKKANQLFLYLSISPPCIDKNMFQKVSLFWLLCLISIDQLFKK